VTEPTLTKKTPIYAAHQRSGATFYTKGGWVRAARYEATSVTEHLRCRETGGIFDVHSMGKVVVHGPEATALLDWACANNIANLAVGAARYTCVCAEDGGIVDDMIVYRTGPDRYYMITNTLSRERVVEFLSAREAQACVEDVTSSVGYIAVQGPRSRDLLRAAGVTDDLSGDALAYFACRTVQLHGVPVLLARTGYTGELGYELNFPAEYGLDIWELLCTAGADLDVRPCGGEALMSLRLEKGYRSYGSDIDLGTNPVEAGLSWTVAWDKPAFSGRDALLRIRAAGPSRTMVYLRGLDDASFARGAKLLDDAGQVVGEVTSGLYCPSVGAHVGLAYVARHVAADAVLRVDTDPNARMRCARRPFFDPAGERVRG
jgi:aminomethyltransferase